MTDRPASSAAERPFETAVAPTLHAQTVTKASDVCLGLAGIAAALIVLVRRGRALAA